MAPQILSFYKGLAEIKSFEGMPPGWQLVNPYIQHWNRFEFFIRKYYADEKPRDLIIALNPGRHGCNRTGIALTDENILFTKLGFTHDGPKPEVEGTATKIYSIIERLHPDLGVFFSRFFMTNIFPFGVVADGKNVVFEKILRIPGIKRYSRDFVSRSIEIFRPDKIICIGRGSEKFMLENFPGRIPVYLHHPAYTFPEKEKERYCAHLK